MIVDEAHNNTSALSFEVLQRVNAACVVEFTATPAGDSNVLHNVSATELKAEEMIKLPIRLIEHKSWEEAVRDSILTRQRLEDVAARDSEYIRPIILFQAEGKGEGSHQGDFAGLPSGSGENTPRENRRRDRRPEGTRRHQPLCARLQDQFCNHRGGPQGGLGLFIRPCVFAPLQASIPTRTWSRY